MENNDDLKQNTLDETQSVAAESAAESLSDEANQPTQQSAGARARTKRGKLSVAIDVILWVTVAVLLAVLVLRVFFFGRITIKGDSMTSPYYGEEYSPTRNPDLTFFRDQVVTVNKLKKPQRGDVAVFYKQPNDDEKIIKRVVALGGDKIWLEPLSDGNYRLAVQTPQGDVLHETYYVKNNVTLDVEAFYISPFGGLGLGCLANCDSAHPYVVKDGCFFALGDNRGNSEDSRGVLGDVPMERMYGVVI